MAKNKENKPRIRTLLRGGFTETQKDVLEKIFIRLLNGETLNVKELRGLNDMTHMRYQEFIDITGLNKNHLTELSKQCPHIINSDGSYSITNLCKYLRSAEYRKKSIEREEIKNIRRPSASVTDSESENEERELTARERIEQAKAIQEEVKASKVQEETITVEEHKKILTTRFINLIDFIKINFECKFKELANKDEDEIKILGKKVMKELLTAYCSEYSSTEEDENE